jgi:hypothetical protein
MSQLVHQAERGVATPQVQVAEAFALS